MSLDLTLANKIPSRVNCRIKFGVEGMRGNEMRDTSLIDISLSLSLARFAESHLQFAIVRYIRQLRRTFLFQCVCVCVYLCFW